MADYVNWAEGQPQDTAEGDADCVWKAMTVGWHDAPCTWEKWGEQQTHAICEKDPE